MLEENIDFIIGVLEEEISKGSMNSALTLSRWNYPELVLLLLGVQIGKACSCSLNIIQLGLSLIEDSFEVIRVFSD